MRNLCICCNINLPVIFRTYRFLEIGTNHNYLDEQLNHDISKDFLVSQILPVLEISQQIAASGNHQFKIAFNLSGSSLLLLKQYTANIYRIFNEFISNNHIEFLISPYSTASLYKKNSIELISQLNSQQSLLKQFIPRAPSAFFVSERYISKKTLTEITDLGINPLISHLPSRLMEMVRNRRRRYQHQFSSLDDKNAHTKKEESSTLDYLMHEIDLQSEKIQSEDNVEFLQININYHQNKAEQNQLILKLRNTFNFMRRFDHEVNYLLPSECINSPSWKVIPGDIFNDDEPTTSMNEIQLETCQYLSYISGRTKNVQDKLIQQDWQLIRDACHLFFMDSRFFKNNFAKNHINPYASPYLAFINYTNILEDFNNRLDKL